MDAFRGGRRWFRTCLAELQLRNQWQIAALFIGNFGGNLLHLHKAYGRDRVRHCNAIAVGIFHRESPPKFFRIRKNIACTRRIVRTDIVSLTFKLDAECPFSRAREFPSEYAAGRDPTEQDTSIDRRSAGPAEEFVRAPCFQMAEIGMR